MAKNRSRKDRRAGTADDAVRRCEARHGGGCERQAGKPAKAHGAAARAGDGEFSEEDIDKYVFGVRVYEDRFEWLLNLSPEARGELDDAGSPVYFTKLTVTPDDERAWFRMHPQWSKSNKYAELEAWIFI